MHPGGGCSHLVSHSLDDTHRIALVQARFLFFPNLSCVQPSFPTAFPAGGSGRWREQAACEQAKADLQRAGELALHIKQVFFSPSQFARGMNSLLKYLPVLDVTKLQKHGSIFT